MLPPPVGAMVAVCCYRESSVIEFLVADSHEDDATLRGCCGGVVGLSYCWCD